LAQFASSWKARFGSLASAASISSAAASMPGLSIFPFKTSLMLASQAVACRFRDLVMIPGRIRFRFPAHK
jgi:hypothetical protein